MSNAPEKHYLVTCPACDVEFTEPAVDELLEALKDNSKVMELLMSGGDWHNGFERLSRNRELIARVKQ